MHLSILPVVGQLIVGSPAIADATPDPVPSSEVCFTADGSDGDICLNVWVEEGGLEICLYDAITEHETCVYRPDDGRPDISPALDDPDDGPIDT